MLRRWRPGNAQPFDGQPARKRGVQELRIDGLIMCSARNTIGAGTYRRAK